MSELARVFDEAGALGYLLVLLFLAGLAAAPLLGLLRAAGRRPPVTLALLWPASMLLVGAVAWAAAALGPGPDLGPSGPDDLFTPEMRRHIEEVTRFTQGVALVTVASLGAAVLAALNALGSLLALLLARRGTLLQPRPAMHALLPAAGLLLLAAVLLGGAFLMLVHANVGAPSLVVSGLFVAFAAVVLGVTGRKAPAADEARLANWKHRLWVGTALGLLAAGLLGGVLGLEMTGAITSVAAAPPSSRATIIGMAHQAGATLLAVGGVVLIVGFAAALLAGLGGWRESSERRAARLDGFAAVGLLAAASVALAVTGAWVVANIPSMPS